MITKYNTIVLSIVMSVMFINSTSSQETDEKSDKSNSRKYAFYNNRGTSVIDLAGGSAFVEGDSPDSEPDVYFKIGYKQHLTSHLNVNFTFNKYNVTIKDEYNEGFMSFDLNWEFLLSPYSRFSPFLYAGIGYNASNYFVSTATKAQGGVGFEIIVTERLGLKLFGEYNYIYSDELDGRIEGETDDTLIRIGLGLNIYFGGNKKKEALSKKMKTVINSSLIIPY